MVSLVKWVSFNISFSDAFQLIFSHHEKLALRPNTVNLTAKPSVFEGLIWFYLVYAVKQYLTPS